MLYITGQTSTMDKNEILINLSESDQTKFGKQDFALQSFPQKVFSKPARARLDALDNEFFSYPHYLTELLYDYVSRHPEEFGTLPNRN